MFKVRDRVRLLQNFGAEGPYAGAEGTVVYVYGSGDAVDITIAQDDYTVSVSEIEIVEPAPAVASEPAAVDLQAELAQMKAKLAKAEAENERLRAALAWYADDDNYEDKKDRPANQLEPRWYKEVTDDNGNRAREALALKGGE